MYIIKLSAIGSTNTFLKEYIKEHEVQNFTTVVAEIQTEGRGQLGTTWETEAGKNLTFSIFIKNYIKSFDAIFDLNCLLTSAILRVLKTYNLPELYVKWPNDILSVNKKIVGLLIENVLKSDGTIASVVGIGINVNQQNFSTLPKASSISNILGNTIDKDKLLTEILNEILKTFSQYQQKGSDTDWRYFHEHLYRINCKSLFINEHTKKEFYGTIKQVTKTGLLVVEVENNGIEYFNLKDVSLVY